MGGDSRVVFWKKNHGLYNSTGHFSDFGVFKKWS